MAALRVLSCAVVVVVLTGAGGGSKGSTAGFNPVSFTAVSDSDYWLLGTIPCRAGSCYAILRTTDGGRSFTRIPAPRLGAARGVVPTLRFADRLDGFAFVRGPGGAFYATHDGGAAWHRLALGDALAFATGGGNTYLVTARCYLQACTGYRFRRSPVSANAWNEAELPFDPDG